MYPLEPVEPGATSPPSASRYLDGRGEVGVIASVTEPFCDSCDRVRLTADGQLRTCLFALDEIDLRAPAARRRRRRRPGRGRSSGGVGAKWAGHQIDQVHFIRPGRSMSQIGG